MNQPVLGPFLGILTVYAVLRVLLHAAVGFDYRWEINVLNGCTVFFTALMVGGSIGGVIQLWKQGRAAEIRGFLRNMLGVLCRFLFMGGPMFLGGWLGDRFYGSVGYDIGLVVGAVLTIPVMWWLAFRSSREKPSSSPPA